VLAVALGGAYAAEAFWAVAEGLATPWEAWVGPRPDRMVLAVGGRYAPWTVSAPWRLVTSWFVHIDLAHLLVNLVAAVALPRAGGDRLSGRAWVVTFGLAGLAGGLLGDALGVVRSAGASGGLHGWLALLAVEPGLRGPVVASAILSVATSLFVPAIDVGAHVGGVVVGLLAAAWLSAGVGRDGAGADDGASPPTEGR